MGEHSPAAVWRLAEDAIVAGDVTTLEKLLRDHADMIRTQDPQSSWLGGLTPAYGAGDARAIIVRTHDFESWDQFAAHVAALEERSSPVARFETAIDAVVNGDLATLEREIRRDPDLIRMRSTRTHHSMLLHYVGANGVEGFRQRTPDNAVQIAEALFKAGAPVDAVADVYGGATTLGLVATSSHPKRAGLQEALMDVLLAHGARLDDEGAAGNRHALVNGCLANGCPEAAEFLARRGAPLDLEGAAGLGRLDLVQSLFSADGILQPAVTPAQIQDAFKRACSYGRTSVVEFLLDRSVDVTARLTDGVWTQTTGLHLAAYGGHVETVKALVRQRALVDAKDDTYGTTPLIWALHAWSHPPSPAAPDRYHEVVALLVAAGAEVKPEWLEAEWLRADPKMLAALSSGKPRRATD